MKERIFLSPPSVDSKEIESVSRVLESGWVAPVGPELDLFENSLSEHFGGKKVLALNSGTAALHLSLVLAGVSKGDLVITATLTFAACANAILYQEAVPVFLDSEIDSWNLDPKLLEEYLNYCKKKPKAIIVTHLYGVAAQMDEIKSIAHSHGIVLIEDAAEAMGSYAGKGCDPLGAIGDYGVISFNGNKIMTTSGGGALICHESEYESALHLATQANRGKWEYDHNAVGYNYRMSNVLAGLGRSQLEKLSVFIEKRKEISNRYKDELSDFIDFPEGQNHPYSNHWLTVGLLKGGSPVEFVKEMDKKNIECRRVWKPLHLHAAYNCFEFVGEGYCLDLFNKGVCLPSGSNLTHSQQSRIIKEAIKIFENT